MTELYIIKKLRQAIPKMKCRITCSGCCGPIIFSKWEWGQIEDKREAKSFDCPYASSIGCEIYNDRPILCRLFGAVSQMECPFGYKPEKMLPDHKGRQIIRIYKKTMAKSTQRI